jgi:hypothetical protein
MHPLKVEIFEVNYSVSPGGIDEWEMNVYLPNYTAHFSEFKTLNEALEFVMKHYPTRELSVSIKSLEWYRANEEKWDEWAVEEQLAYE